MYIGNIKLVFSAFNLNSRKDPFECVLSRVVQDAYVRVRKKKRHGRKGEDGGWPRASSSTRPT